MRPSLVVSVVLALLPGCGTKSGGRQGGDSGGPDAGVGRDGGSHADAAARLDAPRRADAIAVGDAPAPDARAHDDGALIGDGAALDGSGGDAATRHDSGGSVRDAGAPPLPALPAGTGSGTTYYVSPSGNDDNAGTSMASPWQTVAKVSGSAFRAGDTVLFEGGQTFAGCLSLTANHVATSAEAPLSIGPYGAGSFTIAANCTGSHVAAVSVVGVSGVYLHDCILRGNGGGAEYGVFAENVDTSATQTGLRVESCDISGFYTTSADDYGGEIFIAGAPGKLDTVQILNNTLHGGDGPSSPDDNGITGYGTKGNVTNVLYQGNEVYDVGSKAGGPDGTCGNCILAIGVGGGLVQYNVAHGCGGNTSTCGGPAGIWTYASDSVVIQYNEAYGIKPVGTTPPGACDWDGYDLDGNVTNSVLQYNYSHDNYGVGLLGYINETWSGNVIRYNLSQNDGQAIALGGNAASTTDLAIFNNTLYSDLATSMLFEVGASGGGSIGGHVLDNIFYMGGTGDLIDVQPWNTASVTGLEFLRNDYYAPMGFEVVWGSATYTSLASWAAATNEETRDGGSVAISVDPGLVSPGSGGTTNGYAPSALGGYRLVSGSPLVGVGIDPHEAFGIDAGAYDYFGDPIPGHEGTGTNVGADGTE